jgi:uncharacterized membrane protein
MADAPLDVVVAAFNDEKGADAALAKLKAAQKEGVIKVKDAALLNMDANSKLHVKETGDMTGTRGAAIGGVTGAVVGVIAGPVGWAALGGAAIGGLVAKIRDSGFNNTRLEQWGANLSPGSSAIVAVIEHTWVNELEKLLQQEAKEIVSLAIEADIATQLEAQKTS